MILWWIRCSFVLEGLGACAHYLLLLRMLTGSGASQDGCGLFWKSSLCLYPFLGRGSDRYLFVEGKITKSAMTEVAGLFPRLSSFVDAPMSADR